MKMTSIAQYCVVLIIFPVVTQTVAMTMRPDDMRIPDEIKVYYSEKNGISRTPFKGAKADVLPTNNDYKATPGCYIACYSNNTKIAPNLGAYPVGDKTFIMGQVRVQGHYKNGLCIPQGHEDKDVRASKGMKEVCEKSFPAMCEGASCFANSHTANWFW